MFGGSLDPLPCCAPHPPLSPLQGLPGPYSTGLFLVNIFSKAIYSAGFGFGCLGVFFLIPATESFNVTGKKNNVFPSKGKKKEKKEGGKKSIME